MKFILPLIYLALLSLNVVFDFYAINFVKDKVVADVEVHLTKQFSEIISRDLFILFLFLRLISYFLTSFLQGYLPGVFALFRRESLFLSISFNVFIDVDDKPKVIDLIYRQTQLFGVGVTSMIKIMSDIVLIVLLGSVFLTVFWESVHSFNMFYVFSFISIVLGGVVLFAYSSIKIGTSLNIANTNLYKSVVEKVEVIKDEKVFNVEDVFNKKVNFLSNNFSKKSGFSFFLRSLPRFPSELLVGIIAFVALYPETYESLSDSNKAVLATGLLSAARIMPVLGNMSAQLSKISSSLSAWKNLKELDLRLNNRNIDESRTYNYHEYKNLIDNVIDNKGIAFILGDSGSGKSFFLECYSGLRGDNLYKGEIPFNDLAIYFQHPVIIGGTVQDNIIFNRKEIDNEIFERVVGTFNLDNMSERLHLYKKITSAEHDLSGGERVIIGLCRALVSKTDLIMLDEPTNGLDGKRVSQLLDVIRAISKYKAIAIVSHDLNFINELK